MRILVVDDDLQLGSILDFALSREGFAVSRAQDGERALELWRAEQPDLVLLDLNLPRLNGQLVLRRIRAESRTPVILLTVRSDEEEIVRGLEAGADDYISKPFSPKTLIARIRAVLRRSKPVLGEAARAGELVLDLERQQVRRGSREPVHLTPLEFRLLHQLMLHRGHVLTTDALIEFVWGYGDTGDKVLLKQLVRRLRRKIEPDPGQPRYIETVPNVGYCFSEAGSAVLDSAAR